MGAWHRYVVRNGINASRAIVSYSGYFCSKLQQNSISEESCWTSSLQVENFAVRDVALEGLAAACLSSQESKATEYVLEMVQML